ncbi:unnamed protein product [Urochloa humidicola]
MRMEECRQQQVMRRLRKLENSSFYGHHHLSIPVGMEILEQRTTMRLQPCLLLDMRITCMDCKDPDSLAKAYELNATDIGSLLIITDMTTSGVAKFQNRRVECQGLWRRSCLTRRDSHGHGFRGYCRRVGGHYMVFIRE